MSAVSAIQPNSIYSFTARGRFDQQTFTPERLEFESRANFDRWTLQLLYGDYAAQPDLGLLTRREGILGGASFKVTANWIVLGSAALRPRQRAIRPDPDRASAMSTTASCCRSTGSQGYTYTPTQAPVRDSTIMFQFSLRTLGPDVLAPIASSF